MVRAGARLRIARNLRKAGQFEAALAEYQALAQLEAVLVDNIPAGLLGRRARCALLAERQRFDELRQEAKVLRADLYRARWLMDQAVYRLHAQDIADWIGPESASERETLSLAGGLAWLWEKGSVVSTGKEWSSQGRHSLEIEGRLVTLLWKHTPERTIVLIAGPRYAEQFWLATLQPILAAQSVLLALKSSEGQSVHGASRATVAPQTQRSVADTGLPWTLLVANADPQAEMDGFAARRRLLLAGLMMIVILVSAGSYAMSRALLRELAAARLQSDFVAAVSHEFRTPLASLRQLTENLVDGRVTTEERLQTYHQAQARATRRLHRLVEDLLDFGRMEAGALRYRLAPTDAGTLVRTTVEEFQQEVACRGCTVEAGIESAGCRFNADREALMRALWNLLDNAVKYSPAGRPVQVEMARSGDWLEIAVRDHGLGIDAREQKKVFRKFFRGSASVAAGAKGTGLGLAMVEHIVRAHGGTVRLKSILGQGSTFTICLPVLPDGPNGKSD